jgi:hypothetical protein
MGSIRLESGFLPALGSKTVRTKMFESEEEGNTPIYVLLDANRI